MVTKTATRPIDVEPIDRLEEKVKMLVSLIERLKGDVARIADDNARLSRELESAHTRLMEAENASGEITSLRDERNQIRARVATMLEQLEGLSL
jgi:FtsZ-binding cell division protein ZapB